MFHERSEAHGIILLPWVVSALVRVGVPYAFCAYIDAFRESESCENCIQASRASFDQRALDSVAKNSRRDGAILFDVQLERFK